MKRNITKLTLSLLVLALVVVGATWAWFTDDAEVENRFATGDVAITLHDLLDDEEFPVENGISGVTPGDVYGKNVFVSSQGSVDTYVRVKLTPAWNKEEPSVMNDDPVLDVELVELNLDLKNWVKIGDWYYYKHVLEKGDDTSKLLDGVTFSTKIDNDYANASFTIDVVAEAIQATNGAIEDFWKVDSNTWVSLE